MSSFPQTGETFGRYRIIGRLGQGGMGVVFRALQTDLNREVALKVLPPHHVEVEEFRERFIREAGILASVDSPHIIAIFEHGEHNGCLFIATQLVQGGDLGDRIASDGPLPLDVALDVMAQLAEGLASAHGVGVIHRDVKPSNVLLRPNDDGFHAYLCDFGIARGIEEGLTQAGVVVGTFGYLAPERCNGGSATPASDIYSLGCLLVTALTGTAPYTGTDFEVAQHHVSSPIPQWEETTPVLAQLNTVVRRSMAKDPAQRYQSASEMRRDLLAARQTLPGDLAPVAAPAAVELTVRRPAVPLDSSPSAPPTPSAPTHADRRKRAVILGAVVAALIASAGGLAFAVANRNPSATPGGSQVMAPSASPSATPSDTASPTPPAPGTPARTSEEAPVATEEQVGTRYQREDLECTGEYIVVLSSALDDDSSLGTVDTIMNRFDNTEYPPRYVDTDDPATCQNLSHMNQKGSPRWLPYLGGFDSGAAACAARLQYADTSTYVAQLAEDSTLAVYCACDMASSDLPALSTIIVGDELDRRDAMWVLELQYMLHDAGHNPTLERGGYGSRTTAMVRDLQRETGVDPTGEMDIASWDKLKAKVCP